MPERRDVQQSFNERRMSHRIRKVIPVAFRSARELVKDQTLNLSGEGMFICSKHPPVLGETVTLKLSMPEKDRYVIAEAEVKHVTALDAEERTGRIFGFGVRIKSFREGDEEVFRQFYHLLKGRLPYVP